MTPLSRRSVIAGSAAAVTVLPAIAALPAVAAHAENAELILLWRQLIELEQAMRPLLAAEAEASSAEFDAPRPEVPWKPRDWDHMYITANQVSDVERVLTLRKGSPTELQLGIWHVLEWRREAERWQPYPTANTAEEAYAKSQAKLQGLCDPIGQNEPPSPARAEFVQPRRRSGMRTRSSGL